MSGAIAGDLLRTSDFPNGIATASDVLRLGTLLNPRLKKLEALSSQGVSVADNLDGQIVSFQVTTPSPWIAAPLLNSWQSWGAPSPVARYFRDACGVVHISGFVKTGASGTVAFVLPAGYRPAFDLSFVCQGTGGAIAVNVFATGNVGIYNMGASNVTAGAGLDGISFLAEDCSGSPGILSCFPQQIRIEDGRTPITVMLLSCQDHAQANPAGSPNSGATTPSILVPGLQWSYLAASQAGQPNLVSIDGMLGLAFGRTYDVSVLVLFDA